MSTETCKHKTGVIVHIDSPYRITHCEWGCNQYLAWHTADGITYIIGEFAAVQTAHDAIRQARAAIAATGQGEVGA